MALTEAQKIERLNGLGGSDAAVAVGLSSYKTPLRLYLEKIQEVEAEDISDQDAVYWGNVLERTIANEYVRRTGNKLTHPEKMYRHDKYEFMTANLDGLVSNLDRIFEAKTASIYMAKEWGEIESNEIPLMYFIQTQHYIKVLEKQSADVAVLIGGQDYRIYHIERDDQLIDSLIIAEQNFWNRVITRNPPNPTNNDDLKLIYDQDNGSRMPANNEVFRSVQSLAKIKLDIKTKTKMADDLSFLVKKHLGECSVLTFSDSIKEIASWKTQKDNKFKLTDFKDDHPELYQRYLNKGTRRVLRLKKLLLD